MADPLDKKQILQEWKHLTRELLIQHYPFRYMLKTLIEIDNLIDQQQLRDSTDDTIEQGG